MHIKTELLNICISTNRRCNLRCEHCYIQPELLKSKEMMSRETYRKIYSQLAILMKLDKKTEGIAVEVLGGETTLMPVEWWQEMLPFSLKQLKEIPLAAGQKHYGELVFITNNTTKNPEYINLLNRYKDDPQLEVFTSWEPETGRFKVPVMKERFMKNCKDVKSKQFCLSIIPTKSLLEIGGKGLVDGIIAETGVGLLNIDMLYPYGSGKDFFKKNQPDYIDVANFYVDLHQHASKATPPVLIPLVEEIQESLSKDKPFCNMGNDSYGIDIEADGITTLNSTQTGTERELGGEELDIHDDQWPIKFIFENAAIYERKKSWRHDFCFQCEFLTYCGGGYYEHKLIKDEEIERLTKGGGCPGFKQLWESQLSFKSDRSLINHKRRMNALLTKSEKVVKKSSDKIKYIPEEGLITDAEGFYLAASKAAAVEVSFHSIFEKSVVERLWFYDALGITCRIKPGVASVAEMASIVEHITHKNYKYLNFDRKMVEDFVLNYPDQMISKLIIDAKRAINAVTQGSFLRSSESCQSSGLKIDARNDELFSWLLLNDIIIPESKSGVSLSATEALWVNQMRAYARVEMRVAKNNKLTSSII